MTHRSRRSRISGVPSTTGVPVCPPGVRPASFYTASSSAESSSEGISRPQSESDNFWNPGQTIPMQPPRPREVFEHSSGEMAEFFASIHSSLGGKLDEVMNRLTGIESQMSSLQARQKSLEDEVRLVASSSSSPGSSGDTPSNKRKRLTPIDLQSRIRTVYNSMPDESQFKLDEKISSEHNSATVRKIKEAIGETIYSPVQIQKGCKTYKKSIAAREKETSPVRKQKLIRSLKQRSYERRSSVVRPGKEADYWKDVTPDMMSDEEKINDVYVRHPPSYRSEKFHNYLIKLDKRVAAKGRNVHARFQRQEGAVLEKDPPPNCKRWMVKSQVIQMHPVEEESVQHGNDQLPMDDDGDVSSDADLSSDAD